MRVDDHGLTDPVSSAANRAAESQRIQVDTADTARSAAAPSADHVDLSGLAGRIAQTMQALSSQTAQRVSQLRHDFQAGAYHPDAGQIAGALVRS